ncbi:ABC transporter substrate-binding protein [Fervidicella metallireducens]|uniref:ABC transporter substrate-binding protein n=1 Tax=Fervidicella metallireducens TaxID=655338 RepID=UPI001FA7930B|nr:ABC transporter substrate-binding protein [Fervidicella metallireducens]
MNKISEKVMAMIETASMDTEYTKASIDTLSEVSKNLLDVTKGFKSKLQGSNTIELKIRTYINGAPSSFDPAMAFDQQSGKIFANNHAGLLIQGMSTDILPGVAKSWYVEEDNVTWIFNLRKGAKFHNGREITADDVKYSLERILTPSLNSPNAWFLSLIYGADDFQKGKTREVLGIKVLDKYRVSIKLTSPYTGFLLNLAQSCCSIMAKEEVAKGNFVGCGPFYIEKTGENECVLAAFKEYFGGSPYVDKVEIVYQDENAATNFIEGRYDFIIIDNMSAMKNIKESKYANKVRMENVMTTSYAGFNLRGNSVYARNKEVRKAINYAIDRKYIINEILGGMAVESKGPFPPSIVDNSYLPGFSYNPQKAKEILRKAVSGKLDKLVILAREGSVNTTNDKITDCIVKNLKEIGIDCVIVKVPSNKYLSPESISKCDIFISGWVADTGDADNYLEPLFNPDNYTNFTGYNNPEVLELMKQAREMLNPEKRLELYKRIQNIIVDDAPWLFLHHPQSGVISRDGIAGVRMNSLGKIKYDDIFIEKI